VEGHQGEGLPFLLPRVEARLRHASPEVRGKQLKPVTSYLRENFYLTTAGAFRTQAFIDTLLEVADHVLFSADYPYETMQEQSDWFESLPISEGDRLQGRPIECPAAAAPRLITSARRCRPSRR
jgi:gamma-resorcylate decarboxylase